MLIFKYNQIYNFLVFLSCIVYPMLDEFVLNKLAPFGITENFLNIFNNSITSFLLHSEHKKVENKTIIFSDLHANLPALEMTFSFAEKNGINSFISLGDLIEYNTHNDEVLDLIQSYNSRFIANIRGNHDDGMLKENHFLSALFQDIINKEHGQFLFTLHQNDLITINNKQVLLCHSNPWNVDALYLFPEEVAFMEYFLKILSCDGFMFGHTHFVTWYKSLNDLKFAFNPGSLGVSRDGNKALHFSVLDPNEKKFELYEFLHENNDFTKIYQTPPQKIDEFHF